MICSICIATYKRPQLLDKLLKSLYAQELNGEINLEIIVVDNDAEESGRNICERFKNTDKIVLYYLTQPEKNISLTRNKSVQKATGEFILFADDDVEVVPKWVYWHLNTLEKYNADIVIGRATAYFETKVPDYVRKHEIFNIPSPPTGTPATRFYTGNCALKAKLIKSMDEPFDPALGIIGGEDGKLFEILYRKGAKAVCSYEASAAEFFPAAASTVNWMKKRSFRQGYTHTYDYIKNGVHSNRLLIRSYLTLKALAFGVISLLLTILTFFNRTLMVHWFTKIYSNTGHFLAAIGYKHKDLK